MRAPGLEPGTKGLRVPCSATELRPHSNPLYYYRALVTLRQPATHIKLTRMDFYELTLCGLHRKLPFKYINKNTRLANFNVLGDVELVEKISGELAKKLKSFKPECIVGPEVKVVPIIHELTKKLRLKHYVICRKSVKPYMVSPIILKPLSHFPKHTRPLVIDGGDKELLKGKRVIILDDVVSTGVTIRMVKKLMDDVGAKVVATAAIIKQGENQFDNLQNLIYLATLPILKNP